MRKLLTLLLTLSFVFVLAACGSEGSSSDAQENTSGDDQTDQSSEEGNSEENNSENSEKPEKIVMGFVPSQDSDEIADTVEPLANELGEKLGVEVEGKVMNSYSAVVEGMGSGQIHIGFLPAFAYVLANEKYDVEVMLKSERYGSDQYRAQYVVPADSDMESLEDLEGKKWAIPDITSTSGFLFPAAQIMDKFEVDDVQQGFFEQTITAGGHDNAIITLLEGNADVATTFEDARTSIEEDYPKVMEKTKILGYTDWIPNDTISVIPSLSDDMKQQIHDAFMSFNENEEMIKVMNEVYSWDAIVEAEDKEYDIVRDTYEKFKDQISIDEM
ncbi:phosphate/phosphite/phosphonate ABC transporter substrate-binding protein [Pontibacillus yanchengensis]|uniref:Phosphonate ABC transporter substrate-binding protein n=1 Tax=Pontibacillus yanchengensis Y32 TaxID=1385514 RepID=A0A0A2TJY4_9BACI|nr:phosphate/phosphite/phosphonate ABC transporter substrate-binding protein [Pontibacillus yanchengensis]KGP74381.1 phosphonate ABC transporter substrate-binding protein [Pontibacillus yanchengensis Y32]